MADAGWTKSVVGETNPAQDANNAGAGQSAGGGRSSGVDSSGSVEPNHWSSMGGDKGRETKNTG
jgi:hypothetical protein